MTTTPFVLYRFFNASGELLYVGISINPGTRFERHRSTKIWWSEVARIEIEHHDDMKALRMAERLAIEAERPLYNVQMNRQPVLVTRLIWTCDVCAKPIDDDTGYLVVPTGEIRACQEWDAEFTRTHQDDSGLVLYNSSDLEGMPADARWRSYHGECDPSPAAYDYWIAVERIRTLPDVLAWSAHLFEKNWLTFTDWPHLLRRLAKGSPEA